MAIELKRFDSRLQGSHEGAEVRHLDPTAAPYYLPIGDEVEIFSAAYKARLPVLLKGPTGCGKTRFVEHMAHLLAALPDGPNEMITADETVWVDGPLTQAVRRGAICYLDEIVEARKDTTVLIHPLSDHRRILPVEKRGETLEAHVGFLLVISYNPGYQSIQKNLKHSTRQRFVTIEFGYPPADKEVDIIKHEAGVEQDMAYQLALLGEKVRNLKASGLEEGVSTRLLIYAGELIRQGIAPRRAATVAVTWSLTDELDSKRAIDEIVKAIFP